jgi:predicted transcriptional regulator
MPRLGARRDVAAREAVLAAVASGLQFNFAIAEHTKLTRNMVTDILGELVNSGKIRRTRRGEYAPVEGVNYPIDVKPLVTIGDWSLVRP